MTHTRAMHARDVYAFIHESLTMLSEITLSTLTPKRTICIYARCIVSAHSGLLALVQIVTVIMWVISWVTATSICPVVKCNASARVFTRWRRTNVYDIVTMWSCIPVITHTLKRAHRVYTKSMITYGCDATFVVVVAMRLNKTSVTRAQVSGGQEGLAGSAVPTRIAWTRCGRGIDSAVRLKQTGRTGAGVPGWKLIFCACSAILTWMSIANVTNHLLKNSVFLHLNEMFYLLLKCILNLHTVVYCERLNSVLYWPTSL